MRFCAQVLVALMLATGIAFADDIVTMPTANQLKRGEVDVAQYYLALDMPAGAPQNVWYQTLYIGLTDRVELDVHRAAVDKDKASVLFVGSWKLLAEGATVPDLVVGLRNFTEAPTTNSPMRERSKDVSAYAAMAKTFFWDSSQPGPPLVRAHLGFGTPDYTLLGEKRHQGVFGGLQFLFHPMVGAVVQHDGQDLIYGLTIMPPKTGFTLKAGAYGDHTWSGISYRTSLF